MLKVVFPIVALLLFGYQQASCHNAWLKPKDGGLILAYGHGEKLDPYDPEKVKDIKAIACGGESVPVDVTKRDDGVMIASKGQPAAIIAMFDGGYGVKTPDGWQKITKREATGKFTIVEALKSRKYTKALLKPCEAVSKPIGVPVEIVPEKDPLASKAGDSLSITVLHDGKPVEGAVITTGDTDHSKPKDLRPKTDKDGKANVVIEKPGFQLINASFRTPLKDDPDADILSLSSSLTFEVK